jgi:hypothetical protein
MLIDEFKKAINDALVHEAYAMAEGGASSYDDYRYRVGVRKGLKRAMQILDDVVEEMMKRDEKF